MTKWFWSGALVAALGAGTALTAYWKYVNATPTCCIAAAAPAKWPEEAAVRAPTSPPSVQPFAPLPVILDDASEPIVTRPEPLEDAPPASMPDPALTGGTKESDATATLAPRPDRDRRRMPYADDATFCTASRVLIWLAPIGPGFVNPGAFMLEVPLAKLVLAPPDAVEESDEPPILDDALPPYYHAPQRPCGGQCPCPSSLHRTVGPR